MKGGKRMQLLLLAVFLGGCQSLEVSMVPKLRNVHIGDLFYLRCKSNSSGVLKWLHNGKILEQMNNEFLKIPVAAKKHSGTYECERSGTRGSTSITIHDYHPTAQLTLVTGQPVMKSKGSAILRLRNNNEVLMGWNCFVFDGKNTWWIQLKLEKDTVSLDFQTRDLVDPETTFWCSNKDKIQRSNQITIRTSGVKVAMEIYFAPVVAEGALMLRCLNWDNEDISRVAFYKNNTEIMNSTNQTYTIAAVKESDQGAYKCYATFTNNKHLMSEEQQLTILDEAIRPQVSNNFWMSCSCQSCPANAYLQYVWYKIENSQPSKLTGKPQEKGTYACEALWDSGRTSISKNFYYEPGNMGVWITVLIVAIGGLVLVLAAGVFFQKSRQRRSSTGPVYEDVAMKTWEDKDDRYERLSKKDNEYDTLHTANPDDEKKERAYQPLAELRVEEAVYHTLGMEGGKVGVAAAAAAGGYEELEKKTMKEEIYHSIGMEGAAGGEQK